MIVDPRRGIAFGIELRLLARAEGGRRTSFTGWLTCGAVRPAPRLIAPCATAGLPL